MEWLPRLRIPLTLILSLIGLQWTSRATSTRTEPQGPLIWFIKLLPTARLTLLQVTAPQATAETADRQPLQPWATRGYRCGFGWQRLHRRANRRSHSQNIC